MDALVYLVPVLGCGLMMGVCMFLMGRMMRGHANQGTRGDQAPTPGGKAAPLQAKGDSTGPDADG